MNKNIPCDCLQVNVKYNFWQMFIPFVVRFYAVTLETSSVYITGHLDVSVYIGRFGKTGQLELI